MHIQGLVISLVLAGSRLAGAAAAADDNTQTKRFIIEFAEGVNKAEFISQLSARPGAKILKTYDTDIFSGVTIESHTDNVETLQAVGAQVANVWAAKRITLNPAQAPTVLEGSNVGTLNYTTHTLTGVDKVHAQGILGQGVVVAVVDTGIYYTHDALGGGFGPGFKITGGYDLVGDTYNGLEDGLRTPDNDPLDQVGHGTHVAGIIAGKSDWYTGVAPEATLLIYKVFSDQPGTYDDILVEAFLAAYEANADIITCSIGGLGGFSSDPWAVVADRMVEQGVVVTIAMGNNGNDGPFRGSNGASGKQILAVASTTTDQVRGIPFNVTLSHPDGTTQTFEAGYRPGAGGWVPVTADFPVYLLSQDVGCDGTLPTGLPALVDLLVVLPIPKDPFCTPDTPARALFRAGAKHVMYYNDDRPISDVFYDEKRLNLGLTTAGVGTAIVEAAAAGASITASFKVTPDHYTGMANSFSPYSSYYTSWGPLLDLDLKPDIAAPGELILSTLPPNTYGEASGTSMATPYVAGVAALYISKFGGRSVHGVGFAKELHARIIASATSMTFVDRTSKTVYSEFLANPAQVGAGFINAKKLFNVKTSLSYEGSKILLNDTRHFSRYHTVDITNNDVVPITYTFGSQSAAAFDTLDTNPEICCTPWIFRVWELTPIKLDPIVKLPSNTFTVQPGKTKTAQFSFDLPVGGNSSNVPIYGGKVLINGSNGDKLSIPYFGVDADFKKDSGSVFNRPSNYPYILSGVRNTEYPEKSSFTFNLAANSQDFPRLYVDLVWGSPELRWDIYEANWPERKWQYPPVAGQNGYIGAVSVQPNVNVFDPATGDANDVVSFPQYLLPRTVVHVFAWYGALTNGSLIAPGNYTMRIAALTPFAAPSHSDNWDIWKTQGFQVLPIKI